MELMIVTLFLTERKEGKTLFGKFCGNVLVNEGSFYLFAALKLYFRPIKCGNATETGTKGNTHQHVRCCSQFVTSIAKAMMQIIGFF